jgi:hypothetical protein
VFPHYSLHDESHSRTILERIASLLGPSVPKLSATDLWFLLEAAYLHDIGMVALDATKREDLTSTEFAEHLRELADGPPSDLNAAALRIQMADPSASPVDLLDKHIDLLLVYAEFVRARHSQRAANYVRDPLTALAVPSPRTTLLPNRFWVLLGNICKAHGEGRDFVMNLPPEENGIANELCHPRFVASLLRLGDLLDLDSGRFCPILNATLPRLPAVSASHKRKHEGVEHLLVTHRRIEIQATYSDVDAYLEADRWLGWLIEELREQLLRWDEIAVGMDIGSLPSLGKVNAHLRGQLLLERNARPRFEVDRDSLFELVRGGNIYEGAHDAVREVIQNAIDATLLRIAYDTKSSNTTFPGDPEDLRLALRAYPIAVTLNRAALPVETGAPIIWTLTIEDRGIGMRIDDTRHLLRLGSSHRNRSRKRLIHILPEWARPSGTFGIGIHSLFEYCREVFIKTRHPEDGNGLDISLTSDVLGGPVNAIVRDLRRTPDGFPRPVGTTLEAKFAVPFAPNRVSFGNEKHVRSAISEYDFVVSDEFPYVAARMRDEIEDMRTDSLATISVDGVLSNKPTMPEPIVGAREFDAATGMELRLFSTTLGDSMLLGRYRGARLGHIRHFPLLAIESNLHALDAKALLKISRNDLTSDGKATFVDRTADALRRIGPKWLTEARARVDGSQHAALISLYLYLSAESRSASGDDWRSATLSDGDTTVTLGQIASAKRLELEYVDSARLDYRGIRLDANTDRIKIENIDEGRTGQWLASLVSILFNVRKLELRGEFDYYVLEHASMEKEDVADDALRSWLKKGRGSSSVGRRQVLPCPHRFGNLAIAASGPMWGLDGADRLIGETIVSPFSVTREAVDVPEIEAYVRWIAKSRTASPRDCAAAALSFIEFADALVGDWGRKKLYDVSLLKTRLDAVR